VSSAVVAARMVTDSANTAINERRVVVGLTRTRSATPSGGEAESK
jgi:hypothetical protein